MGRQKTMFGSRDGFDGNKPRQIVLSDLRHGRQNS
jgi:hypothetical protein